MRLFVAVGADLGSRENVFGMSRAQDERAAQPESSRVRRLAEADTRWVRSTRRGDLEDPRDTRRPAPPRRLVATSGEHRSAPATRRVLEPLVAPPADVVAVTSVPTPGAPFDAGVASFEPAWLDVVA